VIVIPTEIRALFSGHTGRQEFRDHIGTLLGYFDPAPPA